MITAIGLRGDRTFDHFLETASAFQVPIISIDIREAAEAPWFISSDISLQGFVTSRDRQIRLDENSNIYVRLLDLSPVLDAMASPRWSALVTGLAAWLEMLPSRVVNRPSRCAHNGSKPLHEYLLSRRGLQVPESVTSSDASELTSFLSQGPAILKSIAGVRGNARLVTAAEFQLFDPRSGPVHIQRFVSGDDLRVHVIGQEVIAQRITSPEVDYRRSIDQSCFTKFTVPEKLRQIVVESTIEFGLDFAGWDFKVDSAGEFVCLEVNPMPGYSLYDSYCDGAITGMLLKYLGGN